MSPAKTQAKLKMALALHQKGDLNGAEVHYREVLSEDPNNYTALANVGAIYLTQGQWQHAERSFKWAALGSEASPELYYKLGVSLQQQGKLDDALKSYHQAVTKRFQLPELYSNLGVIHQQQGRLQESIAAYHHALSLNPDSLDALINLGFAYTEQGLRQEATATYQKALALCPDEPELCFKMGTCFLQAGNLELAVGAYRRALALHPAYAKAYYNLGVAYYQQKKLPEAIEAYHQALRLQPQYVEVYSNLGIALKDQGWLDEAIQAYRQAIAISPRYGIAYANLGAALKEKGDLQDARLVLQQAIQYQPDLPEAHYNLGLIAYQQEQFQEAISAYQNAIRMSPNYAIAHKGLGLLLLLLGESTAGWQEYEWRVFANSETYNIRSLECWNGASTEEELVLIEEQGVGDIIQFIRYASLLKPFCRTLSLAVREPLCQLMALTGLFDKIYALPMSGPSVPTSAKWIYLLSAPGLFQVSNTNPVISDPYLQVPADRTKHWLSKLKNKGELLVALNWQGNPEVEKIELKGRSFPLSEYESLASIPGVRFVSLQKGYGAEQLEDCSFRDRFVPAQNEINQTWDWVETAAIVQACDVVITSDTSIAHLAGALNKPVWILLKKVPEWRWGLAGEHCPWYPSARLFRQTEDGNWTDVMQRVQNALIELEIGQNERVF